MTARLRRGAGLAPVAAAGTVRGVWYPSPWRAGGEARATPATTALPVAERRDEARGVHSRVVSAEIDLDEPPTSTVDAYLRLHLLSHRVVRPNTLNLDGIFAVLPTGV